MTQTEINGEYIMIFLNQLTSAVLQVAILTLAPFLFYLFTHKTTKGFWAWIGFSRAKRVPLKSMAIIFFGFLAIIALPYLWLYRQGALVYTGFTIDSYREYGWSVQTIATILVWAIIQTSLSEEIFFRGFLGRGLSHKFGWKTGTSIQAVIFGLIHIGSVWGRGVIPVIIIFLLTGGVGYALGWLSMKKADESILYGWLVHAAVNIVSPAIVFLFLL